MAVTEGLPTVRVPVLSKSIALILPDFSSTSPPLIKIPISAPLPVPTIMAVGVASPKAQGHAITSTEIALIRPADGLPKTNVQTKKVMMAMMMIAGTKYSEIVSAIF